MVCFISNTTSSQRSARLLLRRPNSIFGKLDRSAAYAARYLAKNVVAAGLAEKCEIQMAYAIGTATPVSFSVKTFGTGKLDDQELTKVLQEEFDLRPGKLIEKTGP